MDDQTSRGLSLADLAMMGWSPPMPQPDPRGPPVSYGAPPPPPAPPRQYGIPDHALAVLRALWEGEKYREKMGAGRAGPGLLYDK